MIAVEVKTETQFKTVKENLNKEGFDTIIDWLPIMEKCPTTIIIESINVEYPIGEVYSKRYLTDIKSKILTFEQYENI